MLLPQSANKTKFDAQTKKKIHVVVGVVDPDKKQYRSSAYARDLVIFYINKLLDIVFLFLNYMQYFSIILEIRCVL